MDKYISKEELLKVFRNAVSDDSIVKKVNDYLRENEKGSEGKDILTDTRIRNWFRGDRGIPDTVSIGASLYMFGKDLPIEKEIDEKSIQGTPQILLNKHLNSLQITKLWAKRAWHVFWVEDSNDSKDLDVQVWHFYEGLQLASEFLDEREKSRWFAHKSLVENKEVPVKHLEFLNDLKDSKKYDKGFKNKNESAYLSIKGSHPNKAEQILFRTKVNQPKDIGYTFCAKGAINSFAGDRTHEFLGGINGVTVEEANYIMSIPNKYIADYGSPPFLSFASLMDPIKLVESLVRERQLQYIVEPDSEVYQNLQPWASWTSSQNNLPENVPNVLSREIGNKWSGFPRVKDPKRRIAFAQSSAPSPLMFEAFVFALKNKQS